MLLISIIVLLTLVLILISVTITMKLDCDYYKSGYNRFLMELYRYKKDNMMEMFPIGSSVLFKRTVVAKVDHVICTDEKEEWYISWFDKNNVLHSIVVPFEKRRDMERYSTD